MVVVAEYRSSVEAEMARSILACAGIQSYIEGEYMSTIYPGVIYARLVVAEEEKNSPILKVLKLSDSLMIMLTNKEKSFVNIKLQAALRNV